MEDIVRYRYLKNKAQVVIFDANGTLVESCDTILPLSKLNTISLFSVFPILESLHSILTDFKVGDEDIYLPRVEIVFEGQSFLFDFIITCLPEYPNRIAWYMHDFTKQYSFFYTPLNERNELHMRNIVLESYHKKT